MAVPPQQGEPDGELVQRRHALVRDARGERAAVRAVAHAHEALAVLAPAPGADLVGRRLAREGAVGVVRRRREDGELVARGDEPVGERAPAALRRTGLGGVVVREEGDVHVVPPAVPTIVVLATVPCTGRSWRS
ncbi:hypothetical protein [Serinibacter arcticus]|uniref:hypothetical protein n=1 Tax=Serinibacter arcticus TaxID=1655435 RepID=UPI001F1A6441|nr:hypothetical protein [Serinibacter arcticus]